MCEIRRPLVWLGLVNKSDLALDPKLHSFKFFLDG
jgi:hypothetical protein